MGRATVVFLLIFVGCAGSGRGGDGVDGGAVPDGAGGDGSRTDARAATADGGVTDGGRMDGGLDGGGPDAGALEAGALDAPTLDAAPATCAARCDCPADTTCTIDGICEGTACTEACSDAAPCPCGRSCVAGYCDFWVGSLTACSADCECSGHERCVDGRCITSCGVGFRCGPGDCDACGRLCNPFSSTCVSPGDCSCDGSCALQHLDGTICDAATHRCEAPAGHEHVLATGAFVSIDDFFQTFDVSATESTTGTALRVTLVADLTADSRDSAEVTVTSPDGSSHYMPFRWACAGGGTGLRFEGTIDLSSMSVRRNGTWRVQITLSLAPGAPSTRRADGAWLYVE